MYVPWEGTQHPEGTAEGTEDTEGAPQESTPRGGYRMVDFMQN